jgi:hypothetical protein
MCSICRNPNCKYRFDVDTWKPEEDLVTINLPESDLTLIESVRIAEEELVARDKRPRVKLLIEGKLS